MSNIKTIIKKNSPKPLPKIGNSISKIKRKTKRNFSYLTDVFYLNFRNIAKRKRVIRRYKGLSYFVSNKKTKKDKFNITQAYSTFSHTIILLIIFWTFLNALSIYQRQGHNFKEKIQVQETIIERVFSGSISIVDNFSSYVGDKILLFGVEDKKAMATILKKNTSTDLLVRNFYSWLDVDYVDEEGNILVTSRSGVLPSPRKVPEYYPIKESLDNKWRFKLGKLTLIKSKLGDYDIIPVAFSIDDNDLNYKGTLISRIIIQKVNDDIRHGAEDEDVSYVVLDEEFNFIAYSENDTILDDKEKKAKIREKLLINDELKNIFENATEFGDVSRDDKLENAIHIGNTTYKDYRKSDYPFIILVSYSKKAIWKSFKAQLAPVLFQSFAITLLFLSALFIFKRIQIVPIIKQLISSRERAEEASKAKSSFLSTISHELRTPMNGIIGMSQILSESRNLDDEEWDQVQTIHRSANALLLILNDILNFSKIEAQKVELEKLDFNIHLLLENTIDIMYPAAIKKNLELFIQIDKNIPKTLIGDPGRIRQIITNLVNNAIKFTEKGQIFIDVLCEKKFRNKYTLQFNIIDSGIGIKSDDLKKLFNQFTQADMSTTRKYGGTGLGLSICKELVKLMGGKIGIDSKVNKGSNFWFTITLPKSKEELEQLRQKEISKIKNKLFAVMDSNEIGLEVIKNKLLNLFNAKTDIINIKNANKNPESISNQLIAANYNSIIINYNKFEDFDSIKIARFIKSNNQLEKIPLILIISSYDKGKLLDKDRALFSAMMTKPIKEVSFIDSILEANKIDYKKHRRPAAIDTMKLKAINKNTKAYKILLCEDNQINIKVILAVLSKMGYEIEVALDGQEGLNKIFDGSKKRKYDIILMDCMMPGMDGFTATRRIRKEEKSQNIDYTPIIALTANISQDDQDKCFKCGMDDFLSKPIQKDLVSEMIEKYVKIKAIN